LDKFVTPTLPLVLTNGLVDSFNPCAFGVLLFFVGLMLTLRKNRPLILTFGFFYILAIFATYLLLGLGILRVTHLFGIPHFMAKFTSLLLVGIGLWQLIAILSPKWGKFWKCRIPKGLFENTEKASIPAALSLGVAVGICEFPCSGGIYLATIGLVSSQANFWTGTGYLLAYNIMFVLPLIILLGLAFNPWAKKALEKFEAKFHNASRWATAVISIVFGIILYLLT